MGIFLSEEIKRTNFAGQVKNECGVDVNHCYQCLKCTAGCILSEEADYTPAQIIQAVRFGQKELVFNSRMPWLCATCETCTTRCPQDVDIAKVMDAVRILAWREKRVPPEAAKDVPKFYKASLDSVKWFGRMYEAGMIAELKLLTRNFFKDLKLGQKMLLKRKLKLIPKRPKTAKEVRKIFKRAKKEEAKG